MLQYKYRGDFVDLKFLGRGAAFNLIEGNNSAFFMENNELFLIDCGESIFESIITNNLKKCVYCMHLNNSECINKALDIGFNVVRNEFRKKS